MTDMISVGTIPLNPSVLDYADAEGKIILWVEDGDEGKCVQLGVKMYGVVDRVYSVRYEDFEGVITKMMGEVIMANADDPFAQLLGGNNG